MMKIFGTLMMLIMTTFQTATVPTAKKDYKEVQISRQSQVIQVSADKLWEIIGPGFENAAIWSTAVDHSVGTGEAQFEGATCNERYCEVNASGFNKISEVLTLYDDKNQELIYEVKEGMPGFVIKAANHWRVVSLGPNESALEMTMTLQMKKFMGTLMGGVLKRNMQNLISGVFSDLKVYAETGKISEEKEKRMAKLTASL